MGACGRPHQQGSQIAAQVVTHICDYTALDIAEHDVLLVVTNAPKAKVVDRVDNECLTF